MMPFLSVADGHDLLRMHAWKKKPIKTFFVIKKKKEHKQTVQTSIRMEMCEDGAAAPSGNHSPRACLAFSFKSAPHALILWIWILLF